jgi:hypothetical protein
LKVANIANTQYFECPVCQGFFGKDAIDAHVAVCLSQGDSNNNQNNNDGSNNNNSNGSTFNGNISDERRKEEEENER